MCKNFLVVSPYFTWFATKPKNKIEEILKCDSRNVTYLISCKCCGKQYAGSSTGFKERIRIHKSDINTGKVRCGVANHLLNVCRSSASKFEYLQVQLTENFLYKMMTILTKFSGKERILAGTIFYVKSQVK